MQGRRSLLTQCRILTDELKEAVQACDDNKANTRHCAMTRRHTNEWTNHETNKNRVIYILLLVVLEVLASD